MPSTRRLTLDEAVAYCDELRSAGKVHITLRGVTDGMKPGYWEVTWQTLAPYEMAQLEGRTARCYCGAEAPSRPDLFGFQYLGLDSPESRETCKHCRYKEVAHVGNAHDRGRHICSQFEPIGPRDTDRYYCGCRGWD